MIEDLRLICRQLRTHQEGNGPPVPVFGIERPGVFAGRLNYAGANKQGHTRQSFLVTYWRRPSR